MITLVNQIAKLKDMDLCSEKCIALLEAIALADHELCELQRKLHGFKSVVNVRGSIEIRDYWSGICVERYVEADLENGANVCWWLELSAPNNRVWLVESRIYFSHGETIHLFPDRSVEHIDEVFKILQVSSSELRESTEVILRLTKILAMGKKA